jgi:hypothetical protein
MMNWNFTTTTLAATVLAVPAMTLAPQAQDLRSSLGETVRALEALTGLAPRVAAGEPEALAQVKNVTQPAEMATQQADERLNALRDEVSRLRALQETTVAVGPASPYAPVTTGLTDAQKMQFAPGLTNIKVTAQPSLPVAELGFSVDPVRQGMNAFRAGRHEECLRILSNVKDDPRALYWKGRAAERMERFDEAASAYKECVAHPKAADLAERAKTDLEFLQWRRTFDARIKPEVKKP